MSVFGAYSHYYDLLYRDKNYSAEATYVHELIREHMPKAKTLLDLGCGTGAHAVEMVTHGYIVTGVDQSAEMLKRAELKLSETPGAKDAMRFFEGDIRTVRLGEKFDAVTCLFHVMSYQTSNEDLEAALRTAAEHLEDGGVFIFDCWYGPAVLTDPPSVRVKVLEDEATLITRIATPTMLPNDNRVDVNYNIIIQEKNTDTCTTLCERHPMRYLFAPELHLLARGAGLEIVFAHEWMSRDEPGFGSWGACFGAKKE